MPRPSRAYSAPPKPAQGESCSADKVEAGLFQQPVKGARRTELYHLARQTNRAIIDKIGITSAAAPPTGRYTKAELDRLGVDYRRVAVFETRLEARIAEVAANLEYVRQHGERPRHTFRY